MRSFAFVATIAMAVGGVLYVYFAQPKSSECSPAAPNAASKIAKPAGRAAISVERWLEISQNCMQALRLAYDFDKTPMSQQEMQTIKSCKSAGRDDRLKWLTTR